MADLIIKNGVVITVDGDRRIIEDGAVVVDQGRIAAVGPGDEIEGQFTADQTIDAARKAVMPGLIDCHGHAGHGLIKTLGTGDAESDGWGQACAEVYARASSDQFWYAEGRLAALERLKCGTTTGVSYLGGGDDVMRTHGPGAGQANARAVTEIGIRGFVAVGANRPPFPQKYADWHDGKPVYRDMTFADQLKTCETLIDELNGTSDGRVHIALTFPVHHQGDRDWSHKELTEIGDQARAMRDLSRQKGVIFTQDGHRDGSVGVAHSEFGLLGPDALFSHATGLTEDEIALCAETGTKIAHNPSAVRSILGRCPAPELIAAGVTVGLGSDGTAPDRSADMFRHMFQCMHYHRRHFRDPDVLPPGKVLEMTTIDAARALGLEKEIGSLELGKKADIILIDLFKPHLYPFNMPLHRITSFTTGADVDTVIVDGKVLMEGRKVLSVDEAEILHGAQEETDLMLERAGLRDLLAEPETLWRDARVPGRS